MEQGKAGTLRRFSFLARAGVALALTLLAACGKDSPETECAQPNHPVITGSTGSAMVFIADPVSASKNPALLPDSSSLDPYRSLVSLDHLSGKGTLQGSYVDVRTVSSDGKCWDRVDAFDSNNEFTYSQKDRRFQEAMAYFFGDRYQSSLADAGVSLPQNPVKIDAHCLSQDNAYFQYQLTPDGSTDERVCLGDSVRSPGSFYAYDA
jgi:hypothetical protein